MTKEGKPVDVGFWESMIAHFGHDREIASIGVLTVLDADELKRVAQWALSKAASMDQEAARRSVEKRLAEQATGCEVRRS